jgi:hypothetical protein
MRYLKISIHIFIINHYVCNCPTFKVLNISAFKKLTMTTLVPIQIVIWTDVSFPYFTVVNDAQIKIKRTEKL